MHALYMPLDCREIQTCNSHMSRLNILTDWVDRVCSLSFTSTRDNFYKDKSLQVEGIVGEQSDIYAPTNRPICEDEPAIRADEPADTCR